MVAGTDTDTSGGRVKHSRFFMTAPVPHRRPSRHGPIETGLFKVKFYGPSAGSWGWYQASQFVSSYKEAVASFHEWATLTAEYIEATEALGR